MDNIGKSVLLTGGSGFLGSYIKSELEKKGFEIITLGRKYSDVQLDISTQIPDLDFYPDYVVHAAGKAHLVPKSKEEENLFFDTNYRGTLNLLEGLKQCGANLKSIIFISSVAVYGLENGKDINENYYLSANTPYGKSKLMAENLIHEFCNANSVNYCILRLPLVAGKNAPGNLGVMVKAIKNGWYFSIGKADNKKSMVMAEDVAAIIPSLFEKTGIYNLTDGYDPTFEEIENGLAAVLKKRLPLKIPQNMATVLAKMGDGLGKNSPFNTYKLNKIQSALTFSDKKAREELGWQPMKVIDNLHKII